MKRTMNIRNFTPADKPEIINLWNLCGLVVPDNDPGKDIELKMKFQPDLFFIGEIEHRIIAAVMAGYDGHRGSLNYLGVHPGFRNKGHGRSIVEFCIQKLRELDCPKINIQVRNSNLSVIDFYKKSGFTEHDVTGMQYKI